MTPGLVVDISVYGITLIFKLIKLYGKAAVNIIIWILFCQSERETTQWFVMTLLLQKLQETMWLYHKIPRQRLACSRGRGGSNPNGSLCISPTVSKMPKYSSPWIYLKQSNRSLHLIQYLTIYPQPTRYMKGCHKCITRVYALLLFLYRINRLYPKGIEIEKKNHFLIRKKERLITFLGGRMGGGGYVIGWCVCMVQHNELLFTVFIFCYT